MNKQKNHTTEALYRKVGYARTSYIGIIRKTKNKDVSRILFYINEKEAESFLVFYKYRITSREKNKLRKRRKREWKEKEKRKKKKRERERKRRKGKRKLFWESLRTNLQWSSLVC